MTPSSGPSIALNWRRIIGHLPALLGLHIGLQRVLLLLIQATKGLVTDNNYQITYKIVGFTGMVFAAVNLSQTSKDCHRTMTSHRAALTGLPFVFSVN